MQQRSQTARKDLSKSNGNIGNISLAEKHTIILQATGDTISVLFAKS